MQEKEYYTIEDFIQVVKELRGENGCPWDKKQTHESLIPCLVEESGEVVEAIEHHDMQNLEEELGDVLLQVVMHARIAEERGDFNFSDVVDGVCRKMIRRHPHVFGNETFSTREEHLSSWRKIKELEKIEKKRKARELAENKE